MPRSFARARSIHYVLLLVAAACATDPPAAARVPYTMPDTTAPAGITVLHLSTPDGSGQVVHPDYVAMPASWPGAPQYLTITPYPDGNPSDENPSLFAGAGDVAWSPPTGVHNPIASPDQDYLSDPDAVYDPDAQELRVYYREVNSQNVIKVIRSADGTTFDAPTTVAEGPNHVIVSPAVVRRGSGDWMMWAVNSNVGCTAVTTTVEIRRSSDGIVWSAPATVNLVQPGFSVWHIDVQWIPSRQEFWALYNVKTAGSCTTPALYLATSADGVHWTTYPSPVLARGAIPEFTDVVYRSTFAYDPATDSIRFWYSGARYESPNYIWNAAFQRRARTDVFADIAQQPASAMVSKALMTLRRGVPPLLDGP